MGTELVLELIENDFFPVLGTVECSNGALGRIKDGKEPDFIGKGSPLSWDYNNGTYVVCDDEGKPWIRSTKYIDMEWMRALANRYNMGKGAFVPHSNDGGTYKRWIAEQIGEFI